MVLLVLCDRIMLFYLVLFYDSLELCDWIVFYCVVFFVVVFEVSFVFGGWVVLQFLDCFVIGMFEYFDCVVMLIVDGYDFDVLLIILFVILFGFGIKDEVQFVLFDIVVFVVNYVCFFLGWDVIFIVGLCIVVLF